MFILYRYMLKHVIVTLLFSLVALCVIFLIVDLLETLDNFIDQNASIYNIIDYYINFFPEILKLLTPIATLLATLFTVGRMSGANEITAMKSGGLSLYKLMMPLIIFSIILSFMHLYFNGWIVPAANARKNVLYMQYVKRNKTEDQLNNLYYRDTPRRIVVIQFYNPDIKTGYNISIQEFSSDSSPRLTKKSDAKQMIWDTAVNSWILTGVTERVYSQDRIITNIYDSTRATLNITHKHIVSLRRSFDEMNFDEVQQYIDMLRQGGKDVRKQVIEYYGDYAFPFANLIVILFGVPFASVRRKGGIAIQIAAAMIISFVYLVFSKMSQTIGYSMDISPVIIAWSSNVIFFIMAIIVIIKTKT